MEISMAVSLGDGLVKGHIRIDCAVVLGSIGDLRIFTPYDLSACRNETQFGDVDFDDGSLG
jgi:hypothetical protein